MSPFIVPTVEGHVHVNGMVDNATLVLLNDKYRNVLPREYLLPNKHIREDGSRPDWGIDFKRSHEIYDAGVKFIREPEDTYLVARKYLTTIGSSGCVSSDLFSSGMNNFRNGDAWPVFRDHVGATLEAMRDAEKNTGIASSLAITMKRHLGDAVTRAKELVQLTIKFKEQGLDPEDRINAFHLAGNESTIPCREFNPVFALIHDALKFKRNGAHASEVEPAEDALEAMELPGVTRLGHMLNVIKNRAAMDAARRHGVAAELLLTSNELLHRLRFPTPAAHPAHPFFDFGIPVIFGTDDPGIIGITIGDEYAKAHKDYGFSRSELLLVSVYGVRFGFGHDDVRQGALNGLSSFNQAYDLGLPDKVFDLNRVVDYKEVVDNLPKREGRTGPAIAPWPIAAK